MFKNKTLLVTGGTGSFGNAVIRRFADTDIKQIKVFSRDEKKQDDMRRLYRDDKLRFYLGDVRDKASVDVAMHGVDYLFHAAALKQVPSCEFFPIEAVKTNVMGAHNVLTSAEQHDVKKVIVLSTDKAVRPINAMGMSKALMEKVTVAKSYEMRDKKMVVCATRYGNVMASRGSVIPLFIEQLLKDGPITITNPQMTRFLLSLDHAVELVLFAFENATGGEVFVKKAPACTINVLARAIMQLFEKEVEVKVIGTRHGEKKHEVLLNVEERLRSEDMGEYFRVLPDNRNLNYERYFELGEQGVDEIEEYNSSNTEQLDLDSVCKLLTQVRYVREKLQEFHEKQ